MSLPYCVLIHSGIVFQEIENFQPTSNVMRIRKKTPSRSYGKWIAICFDSRIFFSSFDLISFSVSFVVVNCEHQINWYVIFENDSLRFIHMKIRACHQQCGWLLHSIASHLLFGSCSLYTPSWLALSLFSLFFLCPPQVWAEYCIRW